jgi:serine/threonine protein kinase
MPIGLQVRTATRANVNANDFGNRLGESLQNKQIDSKAKLNELHGYVNSKGDNAKIRVVNTTKNKDLAFRVKSWGHDKAYRQERTAQTLRQMLVHAGVDHDVALRVVNTTLMKKGAYQTATASMIKAILNDSAVQQVLIAEPNSARLTAIEPKPEAIEKTLDRFLVDKGFSTKETLGKGAFGVVKTLENPMGEDQVVAKYFSRKDLPAPVHLMLNRELKKSNESYAAYLVSSRDPAWQQPKIVAPSHYIVARPSQDPAENLSFELVPIAQLKTFIRENAQLPDAKPLQCYGLLMNKAPGQEVKKQLDQMAVEPSKRSQMTKSGLETLRTLNSRGFVHRDIKPDNMMFDGQDVSLIDTGMLLKLKKTAADLPNADPSITSDQADEMREKELFESIAGTYVYMHPDLTASHKKAVGTQADLHALGLVALETEAPQAFRMIRGMDLRHKEDKIRYPMGPATFMNRLDRFIKENENTKNSVIKTARKSAIELKQNIKDPQHPAHLGFACLLKADTSNISAARWADRQFSDSQYAELLSHPSLQRLSQQEVA